MHFNFPREQDAEGTSHPLDDIYIMQSTRFNIFGCIGVYRKSGTQWRCKSIFL